MQMLKRYDGWAWDKATRETRASDYIRKKFQIKIAKRVGFFLIYSSICFLLLKCIG